MTAKEAIANLRMIRVAFVEPVTKEQVKLIDDTFERAIKALEYDELRLVAAKIKSSAIYGLAALEAGTEDNEQ